MGEETNSDEINNNNSKKTFAPPLMGILPPPTLPIQTSRFFDSNNNSLSINDGGYDQLDEVIGSSSNKNVPIIPLHSYIRHTQKKLVKLNRKRAAYIKDVPKSDQTIPHSVLADKLKVREYAFNLLTELLPEWKSVRDVQNVKIDRLSGAMTNTMFVCSYKKVGGVQEGDDDDNDRCPPKVLLRVYGQGSEQFFDRQREIFILQVLSCMKVGPRLMGMFENGRFEEFIESLPMRNVDFFEQSISKAIATKLFGIHSLVGIIPGAEDANKLFKRHYEAELWSRLEDWIQKAAHVSAKIESIDANDILSKLDYEQLRKDCGKIKLRVEALDSPIVFAHNDLQYGNILKREPDGDLLLIDFEYAFYNYRGFDIANHFCEWAADYHSDTPHALDFSKYPTEKEQIRFFHAYLDERDRFIQSRFNYRRASYSSIPPLSAETSRIVSSINPQQPFPLNSSHSSSSSSSTQQTNAPLPTTEHPLVSPRLRPKHIPGPSPSLSPDSSPTLSPMLTPQILVELRQMEIGNLLEEIKYFTMLSHVMWALWGIIQASQSVIDFDYVSYASQRISEFERLKTENKL